IAAYYDDRRNQTYGAIDGLGSLANVYREKTGTFTTITSIPDDAATVKYNDGNGTNKGGNSNSELGKIVDLIGTFRGNYASTTPAKNFYNYMRPWRWLDTSVIVPTLVPVRNTATPETDGGFPSGHTNASYLASLALAYSVPERFQEMLTRASEMGNNRIVAGMHSPLDVMGGRVMATALAAATLADPDNAALKQAAYDQAHEILLKETGTAEDRFSDYDKNKEQYTERLTYGFTPIASTTEAVVVPKGAEVLLETRLPYLSGEQRREVLATTGLPSGYPLLDDPEGWGRLNLFAAADGYGALGSNVTVTMDTSKGGFHAADSWRNDIAGTGKLTKEGTGKLTLTGSNMYSGGTELNAGTLEGGSATAFGSGDVLNNGGTLVENVTGKLTIGGSFTQAAEGTLELNVASAYDVIETGGAVNANGTLQVNFADNYVPSTGTITLISHVANQRTGQFSDVEINGLPSSYSAQVVYQTDRIVLTVKPATNPEAPAWGHFVDSYKNNISANKTVESNPTIGVLSGFLDLWTPGSSWDNGTKLNSEVLDYNIQYVDDLAETRSDEEEIAAYYDDRRNQTYGAIDGLGSLANV
uniref:acid phosphatase n=1 Tax=Paenibacillus sp. YIM B09110 TaxID=3126102 RepID=UPI00301DC70A